VRYQAALRPDIAGVAAIINDVEQSLVAWQSPTSFSDFFCNPAFPRQAVDFTLLTPPYAD